MAGMVSRLDRKNCWTIAEHRGALTPDGLQHLLARASWYADDVRDDLRPQRGWPVTKSMEPIPDCVPRSAVTVWGMCWRSRPTGACPPIAGPIGVDALPALIPAHAWQKHSAGAGAHGPRLYSWAWFRLLAEDDTDTGVHQLLIRRNDTTGEHAHLRCYSPRPVPLRTLVAVATAIERDTTATTAGLIALTVNEFRRLFDALLLVAGHTVATLLAWSRWRRRHQYRARLSHYKRREHQ